jgi:tyrosyl-tRNA synthetase
MPALLSIDEQMKLLFRGVEYGDAQLQATMERELRERLAEGRPLRVYAGFDPTNVDLTLGHTLPMRKLRHFQQMGHDVTFLVGTYTALIGDVSDKTSSRPLLTEDEIFENAKGYAEQAFKILDREKTDVRRNGEWLSRLNLKDMIDLASKFTLAQFLQRETIGKRFERGDPIFLHELFYPLMQGYDAVMLECDVQVGGTEQLFNLMAGRELQRLRGQKGLIPVTLPILLGTDGLTRMSKSAGNYIAIADTPEDKYGKTMRLPDAAMWNWFELLTDIPLEELDAMKSEIDGGANPMEVKKRLAAEIVREFHGDQAAQEAARSFEATVQRGETPDEIPEYRLAGATTVNLVDVIAEAGLAPSKGEARRLLAANAVELGGVRQSAAEAPVRSGQILKVGKRRWLRFVD